MESWAVLISLLALVQAPNSPQTQEKYSLKVKQPGKADMLRVDSKETRSNKMTTLMPKLQREAKIQEGTGTMHTVYTETVLEHPEGSRMPTKVKRVYEIAVVNGNGEFVGFKNQQPLYQGKTLLIEKKGEGYEFRIEGGDSLKKDIEELILEFKGAGMVRGLPTPLLPPSPMAVGEKWKVDFRDLAGLNSEGALKDMKVVKSDGSATLTRVYKRGGELFGVIDIVGELEMVMVNDPKNALTQNAEVKGSFKFTFDGCIDGTLAEAQLRGTTEMKNTIRTQSADSGDMEMVLRSAFDGFVSWKEVTKR